MPIASPTSDSLSAGASFVPSPVTATMSPSFFSSCTRMYLSVGDERARTCARVSCVWPITSVIDPSGWVRHRVRAGVLRRPAAERARACRSR